jgi:multiple sugar transport system substrate-binding protein
VPEFLQFVAGGEFQSGGYAEVGGQPAHRDAWMSEQVNTWTPGFFAPTLASLDAAFVRPRSAAYPDYQRDAGLWLHRAWMVKASPQSMAKGLSELWS